jgi:hypothetical protein
VFLSNEERFQRINHQTMALKKCILGLLFAYIACHSSAQQDGVALMKKYDYDRSSSINTKELLDVLDFLEISSDLNGEHFFSYYSWQAC